MARHPGRGQKCFQGRPVRRTALLCVLPNYYPICPLWRNVGRFIMAVDPTGPESDQESNIVRVNRGMSLESSQEPGVAIPERDYIRLIDRLEGCRSTGWGDLWLTGGGVGGGLFAAALVTVISLGNTPPSGTKIILWMLVAIGACVTVLSLGAYCTQRHDRGKQISDLKKDMERFREKMT